ncbi:MAG: EI24 domain-containing protein [Mycobacteriales bacterium]
MEQRPSDFFLGIGYFVRGVRWFARQRRLWWLGVVPALITLLLYAVALGVLLWWLDDLARWVTPFADHWSRDARTAAHLLAGLAVLGAAVYLAAVTFTAVALMIGDPFYEKLAERVEDAHGGAPPEIGGNVLVQGWRGVREGVATVLVTACLGVPLFVAGFVPAVGQTVVPVLAACVSGFFLTVELTAFALVRRGLALRDRIRVLRRHLPLTVGFGLAVFVAFLIPLGAVVAMPGAVAGATLLARERLSS